VPDKSGLPSGVRGVGPFRSTLPSGVRVARGSFWSGHCADAEAEMMTIAPTRANKRINMFMKAAPIGSEV